jgi:hypothetical protein
METISQCFRQVREKEVFDEMLFDIPRLYISACSNSVQLVPVHPIFMSILFHHYKELKECVEQVEQIEARVNNSKRKGLTKKEEKQKQKEIPIATLDSYFISNNKIAQGCIVSSEQKHIVEERRFC